MKNNFILEIYTFLKYKFRNNFYFIEMTRSGFKSAQNVVNKKKKENNNKDYRTKLKAHPTYSFSNNIIPFDYILRTKYGICLSQNHKDIINNHYYISHAKNKNNKNPISFYFQEYSEQYNELIQEELNHYYNSGISKLVSSTDKTKSSYAKSITNKKNKNKRYKLFTQFDM